jgi:hypothetical protein
MKKLLFVVVVLGLVAVSEAREAVVSSTRTATMCDWCDKEIERTTYTEGYYSIGQTTYRYRMGKHNFHSICYDEYQEKVFEYMKGVLSINSTIKRGEIDMELNDVVKKLIGEIEPVGETNEDNKRFENLKVMLGLLDSILTDTDYIYNNNKERIEYSMKRSADYIKKFYIDRDMELPK